MKTFKKKPNPANKKNQERIAIYWDGSNFYHKLKELNFPGSTSFNYQNFSNWLSRNRKIVSNRYYIGEVKADSDNAKSQTLREGQQKFFHELKKQNFKIIVGNLIQNEGVYHEKGTDVEIATDLMQGASNDLFDTAILISSDSDMLPAIEKVRKMGKKVEYVGFKNFPTKSLMDICDKTIILSKRNLSQFINKRGQKRNPDQQAQSKKRKRVLKSIKKVYPHFNNKKKVTKRTKKSYY